MDCLVGIEDLESIENWIENRIVKDMNNGYVTLSGMAVVIDTLQKKIEELKEFLKEND